MLACVKVEACLLMSSMLGVLDVVCAGEWWRRKAFRSPFSPTGHGLALAYNVPFSHVRGIGRNDYIVLISCFYFELCSKKCEKPPK